MKLSESCLHKWEARLVEICHHITNPEKGYKVAFSNFFLSCMSDLNRLATNDSRQCFIDLSYLRKVPEKKKDDARGLEVHIHQH